MSDLYVEIEAFTWNKVTHDLLDYDCHDLVKSKIISPNSGAIYRTSNNCFYSAIPQSEDVSMSQNQRLLVLNRRRDHFTINSELDSANPELWKVVKYLQDSNGYELKESDTLKLGRFVLKVKKIFEGSGSDKTPNESLLCEDMSENSPGQACRICCCEEGEDDNPLISPCKCIGSMKVIHLLCLKKWLESKVSCRNLGTVSSYYWNDFICELCKSHFPGIIKHKGREFELVSIKYPKAPYMVLEDEHNEEGQGQTIHILDIKQGECVRIGRGHNCDIRLTDISVSRDHAKISFNKGRFYLQDNKSKFGTLLRVKEKIVLQPSQNISLQVNRTMLKISVKVTTDWCCGPCFGRGTKVRNYAGGDTIPQSPA
ncbi:hypothetical protein SteCoe_26697 [Stentor coeruleus]|uniref:RING-CH-type domain-containing protein n=1 Tax=Stentor coeruleus TaxID=5963 RepID=A0A1R2BCK9_9CILI|nr:hypothetical protein SteCoe_26697 [Stentor coeruleus]